MGSEPILRLRDCCVRRAASGFAVRVDDLQLRETEVAALVGPSGCGKTSLLLGGVGLVPGLRVSGERQILGGAWPEAGTSAWQKLMRGPVTLLLQDAKAVLDPLQRIETQMRTVTEESGDACRSALAALGLVDPAIAAAYPHTLSGGEAQKVLLAIAALRAPALLIADEPTAGLDGASIEGFVTGLQHLRDRYRTAVLLATHDADLVRALGATPYSYAADSSAADSYSADAGAGASGGSFSAAAARDAAWSAFDLPPPSGVILDVRGLTKSYRGAVVLDGVDLQLSQGEVVAIVGPSGCGKTTLARILTGHLAPDAGTLDRRPARQMLFQDALASLTPGRTIRSLVDETRTASFDMAAEATSIGLPLAKLARTARELSGGERRRAALLRALSVEPSILVLDEPTASLDHDSAVSVIGMVLDAQRRRRFACVLITHDRPLAAAVSHRVLQLQEGRLK